MCNLPRLPGENVVHHRVVRTIAKTSALVAVDLRGRRDTEDRPYASVRCAARRDHLVAWKIADSRAREGRLPCGWCPRSVSGPWITLGCEACRSWTLLGPCTRKGRSSTAAACRCSSWRYSPRLAGDASPGFAVALTQRTHSQRAIGVMSFHISRIFRGAAANAAARSDGTCGSGQSGVASIARVTTSPTLMSVACRRSDRTSSSGPEAVRLKHRLELMAIDRSLTATCPRDGKRPLASFGKPHDGRCTDDV